MFAFLAKIAQAIPLGRFRNEPVRVAYLVAIALQTFATLSLGGNTWQAIVQGVFLAVVGEFQRQRVSPV